MHLTVYTKYKKNILYIRWTGSKSQQCKHLAQTKKKKKKEKKRTFFTHHYQPACPEPSDPCLQEVPVYQTGVYGQTTPCSTDFYYSTLSRQCILTTTISFARHNRSLNCRLLGALPWHDQSQPHLLRHCPIGSLVLIIVCYARLKSYHCQNVFRTLNDISWFVTLGEQRTIGLSTIC